MSKILIVEDDQFLRKVYGNVLEKEGFEYEVATNGQEGLEKAESFQPDLIMLDMLMPGMDGIEFLRTYDLKEKHPDVKVIVFSNMMIQEKIDEAISLGASDYKTKSLFSPKEMMELIRSTLA